MKSIAIIFGLFAAVALSAPVSQLSARDVESDAFDYTNNINNKVDAKDVSPDLFDYHNNIDNGVVVDDVDGTKVILSSPYSDDVNAADRAAVLGE
ncbi:hypothetical protein ONZ43_g7494 [Nemania bipapillata]|uniref:Uncharacterized protein n=1 Tax=Nemania bipapillata TaxID=110536 RepID=A0ACC2HQL7_9PEZI|nr:hypothetical protein ONZ43_g7494 [Nemania bipapillata]